MSDFCVTGFSFGAIKALEYTKQQLQNAKRVHRLQLFTPAFFQTKSTKFKKLQLMGYKKNKNSYMDNFLSMCFEPYDKKELEQYDTCYEELDELLSYQWQKQDFSYLDSKSLHVEVYLGGEDKIIDTLGAKEFFLDVASVTYIKDANHFLQID
jgi:hypothetical protein